MTDYKILIAGELISVDQTVWRAWVQTAFLGLSAPICDNQPRLVLVRNMK